MIRTPLFTRDELATAFAFLLPAERADELATRWFETLADEVDAQGRAVYQGPWRPPAIEDSTTDVSKDVDSPATVASDEASFANFSDANVEDWLMRLGELHLALVALVSDDAYERMRQASGMSAAEAARSRIQIQRAVRAYRRRRGWPPAV